MTADQTMGVALQYSTNIAVISICGDVDEAGWPELERVVADATAAAPIAVFDLARVDFAGSTLLRTLGAALDLLGGQPGSVIVRAPTPAVRRLLRMTGFDTIVAMID